jgi:hypothetical protein
MRRTILDVYWFNSPLYTLRGLFWNIRTLGLVWWSYCFAMNTCSALAERYRDLPTGGDAFGMRPRQVRLAPRSLR